MQEQIGIRVVALPRAAAKNYDRVSVLCDPSDYHAFLQELDQEEIPELSRQKYALEAFEHFAGYYSAIADFSRENYRQYRLIPLRYRTNPCQSPASVYMKGAVTIQGS